MKSILVTGSNGFIGTVLKTHLLNEHYNIYEFNEQDGDIVKENPFARFEDHQIEHIIHLAAKTFVPHSWQNPYIFYTTNVMGTLNVLEFCRKTKIGLTYLSSYLYGTLQTLPIKEDAELEPTNPYAFSKYLAERLCHFYHKVYGIKIVIFRPFNVYGMGQNESFLIPTIIDQVLNKHEIRVKELSSRRDYVYIKDLVHAISLSLKKDFNFEIFNIGSGTSLSVEEVIQMIKEVFRSKKKITCDYHQRKNEISETVADITMAKIKLGWQPQYNFNTGITDIYNQIIHSGIKETGEG
jgi:nucleoside-diphosphate-sugar epimerase